MGLFSKFTKKGKVAKKPATPAVNKKVETTTEKEVVKPGAKPVAAKTTTTAKVPVKKTA